MTHLHSQTRASVFARLLVMTLGALAFALPAVSAPDPPKDANTGKAAASLERALERSLPSEGISVGVVLSADALPAKGPESRNAIAARQQTVLDALPAGSFQVKRRYQHLNGFALWTQRAAIQGLIANPRVLHIYLDGEVHATLAQGAALIGADTLHAQGITGAGIRVAVLDTGIDSDHPDLVDDIVGQQCFCNTHPSPKFGCCPGGGPTSNSAEDDEGHGTSVAGIITSRRAQGLGVAPDAEIVAVKVLDSGGGGSFSDIAAGLDWVLANRIALDIRVVNLSLGDGAEIDDPGISPCTGSNTANAIKALHAAGVSVFVSSGNDGHDAGIAFPACVAEAISVGGVYDANIGSISWCGNSSCTTILCTDNPTAADTFVCHSNSGQTLDLLAPDYKTDTTAMGGGTTAFGGTSASSPYAAAEAALLLEADGSLQPETIRSLMTGHGASVQNPDSGMSFPRSNVSAALAAIAPAVCGDGITEDSEECDDSNLVDGDCCSSTCSFEFSGSACEDGNACTENDACDGAGSCTPGNPQACDDGDFCNGIESCDPMTGCASGTAPVLDDSVSCTVDSCDEGTDSIRHTPDDTLCDDEDPCTAESCDSVLGCVSSEIEGCGANLDIPEVPSGSTISRLLIGLLLLIPGIRLAIRNFQQN